jgi:NADH-quinone oxidoreductase subunit L
MMEQLASYPQTMSCCATFVTRMLWIVPVAPMVAAGVIALLKQPYRKTSQTLAIGSMLLALVVSLIAFCYTVSGWLQGITIRETVNFAWLHFGATSVDLGWILDPLAAVMLVMVSFVGLLIFIYSSGYMAHDENATRFFCFLALFAGAMLGLVMSNSLLLLFMCWELMGLTSYLLIGFWYQKPSASAAAKKAFLTTRVGDIFFLLGIVWLFAETGTLLFYNNGAGSIESAALATLLGHPAALGLSAATAIGLLLFAGAAGKSGQLPLHVWLPDAMEGPTPVSALIHAATMVAAGVYLIARVYPLMSAGMLTGGSTPALTVVTWVGASTAVFAALIAVAQNDIKRILAYSTVSQLGYMMAGLGIGGVAVGMFHLITHAFFKALLFMGAGSVIHGCHDEQDIRKMGGLKADMPLTFITYSAGMLALAGFIPFAGFWSKDGILEAAFSWKVSNAPFFMLVFGALLTAFYMTRQISYVFFGYWRGHKTAHESPAVMTLPLAILAVFAIFLGFLGTPAWPWFRAFLEGHAAPFEFGALFEPELMLLMSISIAVVLVGIAAGWRIYGDNSPKATEPDALEKTMPAVWKLLANRMYVDELYGATFIRFYGWWGRVADFLDRRVWGGAVALFVTLTSALAHANRFFDNTFVNGGFDKTCEELATGGGLLARVQSGRVQAYLRILAVAVVALAVILVWSSRP